MKRTMIWQFAIALLAFMPFIAKAQQEATVTVEGESKEPKAPLFKGGKEYKKWYIGINGGMTAPSVVTGGSNDFTKWKPDFGYGAYVQYQILHFFGLRLDYMGGQLKGNNDKNLGNGMPPNRPYLEFKTKLKYTGTLNAVFNITTVNWLTRQNIATLYASVGGGLAGYSPTLTLRNGSTMDYKPGGTISELVIPVGAGIKFKLSELINLDLGYTMYYTDGDNLDGYYRGPDKDKFSYGHVGLEFALGKKGRPQLQFHNPAKQMYEDLTAENMATRAKLDAATAANARMAADMDKLTKDSDGDGVSDFFDKCPNTPPGVKVDGSGCPLPVPEVPKVEEKVVITEEDRGIVKEAIRNLEFEFAKASIKPSSYPALDRVADLMKRKNLNLKLSGHTDNVGSLARNMELSKERAEAVKNYLIGRGVLANKIEAVGYGPTQPISSNKTAAGRQKNRRVEFNIF
ncbi:OOP family OmpA-OmpF porin [Chitinophaga dinghuensis]|uniref:OOP family OmpA-OmpF porin n=1 Tax=Chitinophaga dinghuensis TaxID=1539050 RepID=A0A327W2K5_9BACT|nr:OmpA family protein [Chitinophaga dinghuensis]RAJ83507.1 OOP family OmpA-OmpF porin [Chitinophaga dinghuensis]